MRLLQRWTGFAAGAVILIAVAGIGGQVYAAPVDLSGWTQEDYKRVANQGWESYSPTHRQASALGFWRPAIWQ